MAELPDKPQHENRIAQAMTQLSAKHRQELTGLLGDPPDPSNVPASFWARVQRETEEEMTALLILIFVASATHHGMGQNAAQGRAIAWAGQRAVTMAGGYVSNSKERLQTAGREWRQREQPPSKTDVNNRLKKVFGSDRARMVGKTEATEAQKAGGEAWREDQEKEGAVITKIWRHTGHKPPGHAGAAVRPCPICTPLLDETEEEWARFYPSGPPAHPQCDCFLEYRVESEAREPQLA